jgi:hypothetical protein
MVLFHAAELLGTRPLQDYIYIGWPGYARHFCLLHPFFMTARPTSDMLVIYPGFFIFFMLTDLPSSCFTKPAFVWVDGVKQGRRQYVHLIFDEFGDSPMHSQVLSPWPPEFKIQWHAIAAPI